MNQERSRALTALKAAFPHTIPILTGFAVLGIAHGVLMRTAGFSFVWPLFTSAVIFGGSLEFIATEMLLGAFSPLQSFLVGLLVQARHLFYGLAMLERYRGLGAKKLYMIFSLCDETFSINASAKIPDDVDPRLFMFFVSLLDQSYWVTASLLGGILGAFIPFDTEGLDFVMTAMFLVIAIERWLEDSDHRPAIAGLVCSLACLLVFGPDAFLIPAMISILAALMLMRGKDEGASGRGADGAQGSSDARVESGKGAES